MSNLRLVLMAAGLAAVTAPLLSAQKTKTINVTTAVYDCSDACNGANQFLMRSDDYTGIGFATYTTTSNTGNSANLSEIDSDGNWALYLSQQAPRTLWITPNVPVGTQPPAPPANYYSQGTQVHSGCYDPNGNSVPFANLLNGSNNCRVDVEFGYNGLVYKLVMSPNLQLQGPATGRASVVCNAVSNNQCVDWTILPNATAPNVNVANLYYYSTSRQNPGWILVGQYYNTFLIRVTNP